MINLSVDVDDPCSDTTDQTDNFSLEIMLSSISNKY